MSDGRSAIVAFEGRVQLADDDVIYTDSAVNKKLAKMGRLALVVHASVPGMSRTHPTLSLQIEHCSDGSNYRAKRKHPELNVHVPTGKTAVFSRLEHLKGPPTATYVRLAIRVSGGPLQLTVYANGLSRCTDWATYSVTGDKVTSDTKPKQKSTSSAPAMSAIPTVASWLVDNQVAELGQQLARGRDPRDAVSLFAQFDQSDWQRLHALSRAMGLLFAKQWPRPKSVPPKSAASRPEACSSCNTGEPTQSPPACEPCAGQDANKQQP